LLFLVTAALLALPSSAGATFAGSNGKIFFEGPQTGTDGPADVFSIDPVGGEPLDLSKENGFSEERPAASADSHVAYMSFRDEGWNIFKMNADGTGVVDLTNTEDPIVNFEPTWSPDGSEVVYMRQGEGEQDLWRVGADGSNPENLTESPGVQETSAEFSPDGTEIAYVSSGPNPCCDAGYNNDIWVMDADGSNQTPLTETDFPQQNVSPTWSPDGTKIAFSTFETKEGKDDGFHVMDADGTNQVRPLPGGSPLMTNTLSWSPDGTKIAFEPGSGGIDLMNPDGTEITPLVANSGASYPSWVPAASSSGSGESEGGGGAGGGGAGSPAPAPGGSGSPPSNKFSLGKLKLNKKKGTATLTALLPGPGNLVIGGKGVKGATKAAKGAGKAVLPVKAAAKALKKLNESGAVALKAKITFTPTGGSPRTQMKSLTLKKQP
jgi:Tol biopolymer transport system component